MKTDRRSPAWFRLALLPQLYFLAFLLAAVTVFSAQQQVNFLVFGDWGADTPAQKTVASAISNYVQSQRVPIDAVLLLGDNFYTPLDGGVNSREWEKLFEQMYDSKRLAVPFYAILGNHDYESNKAPVELDYGRTNSTSRFKMPGHWYRVEFPAKHPLVSIIGLDCMADPLGQDLWMKQTQWLEGELNKPRQTKWMICMAHYPLFSDAFHGDDPKLQKDWGGAFKKSNVDFYLAGHDHALELLTIPGWMTSFVVSGGGGQLVHQITRHDRAAFAASENGFVHLQLTAQKARVTFISKDGKILRVFERDRRGAVKDIPLSPSRP